VCVWESVCVYTLRSTTRHPLTAASRTKAAAAVVMTCRAVVPPRTTPVQTIPGWGASFCLLPCPCCNHTHRVIYTAHPADTNLDSGAAHRNHQPFSVLLVVVAAASSPLPHSSPPPRFFVSLSKISSARKFVLLLFVGADCVEQGLPSHGELSRQSVGRLSEGAEPAAAAAARGARRNNCCCSRAAASARPAA
jgi:hypothetical protein